MPFEDVDGTVDDCDYRDGEQRGGILATGDARNGRGISYHPKEMSVTTQAPVVVAAAAMEGDGEGAGQGDTTLQRC